MFYGFRMKIGGWIYSTISFENKGIKMIFFSKDRIVYKWSKKK